MERKDITECSQEELESFFFKYNVKPFRIKQLNNWLWQKGANSFDEMTTLSKELRLNLKNSYRVNTVRISEQFKSSDGTIKFSLMLFDGKLIEGVLIPSRKRVTACISSQVGCSLDCSFCATGTLKLMRNLSSYEIFKQVNILNQESQKNYNRSLTNIVYMGMGEPLLNYKSVLKSIDSITSIDGMNISAKRITVSTAGLPKMIMKLADDNVRFNLAISLHSAIEETRSSIMSINKSNNLSDLKKSIEYFYENTGKRITYEYILFNNINDDIKSAHKLSEFCKISPCKVNLIEYNSVDQFDYVKSSSLKTRKFIAFLEEKNIIVNLRRSRGKDIDAACGQLVNKS